MFQSIADVPAVARVPAPWSLEGHGWIVVLRLPSADAARHAFLPPTLQPTLAAPVSVLMYVDYVSAPCGPYRELLFIPGAPRFPDGRRHATITRILVSTWDSVVNGRANWGIPKDRADFVQDRRGGRVDRLVVEDAGVESCRLEFELPRGPRLPFSTSWLPASWTTLAQSFDERAWYYSLRARGTVRPCRLLDWRFDVTHFPDLASATVLASLRVERFTMQFPVARVDRSP